jgi:hypothetical protein
MDVEINSRRLDGELPATVNSCAITNTTPGTVHCLRREVAP